MINYTVYNYLQYKFVYDKILDANCDSSHYYNYIICAMAQLQFVVYRIKFPCGQYAQGCQLKCWPVTTGGRLETWDNGIV